ncbi:mitogen-activated protein kinase kinase 9-like [Phragmites australis]|uniref:mitogen-activated protein kinase kinase 9-like n=1 Tax=Phragmites australis TaxID=29695 RepID=UPI002D7724FE|nr:mitogen-activated protein kinase kinase 9-like [Phragmites australis]
MARPVFPAAPHEMFRRVPTAPHQMMRTPSPAPDQEQRLSAAPHEMFRRVPAAPHQMMRAPSPAPDEELRLLDLERIDDLGEGGFATVTKVRHRRTGAVFALKVAFYPDPDADEEAEVLRRTAGSPHIVRYHALLRERGGELACVLELMDAGSLCAVLRRRGERGLQEPALAEVTAQGLVGLAQLHSRGVAHLDVKPDNLLANARGEVKIGDFNTSKILYGAGGERLLVSIAVGTGAYFSPERFARNAHAGPHGAMAADVWGLGVTVLELFLRRRPVLPAVETPSYEELKQVICHGEPPSVPEDAEASSELRGFVAACLQKDPRRRATVAQLLGHPFVMRRDVTASSSALRELIVATL